jgi:hypothetical protein
MNKQQMEDREQFRRYAEAALSGVIASGLTCPYLAGMSFDIATAMMLAEDRYWEAYQLKSLSAIVDDERIKHEGK